MRRRKSEEAALVAACLKLLALTPVRAWRNNTTGVFDPARQAFRTFKGRRGVSDILGYVPLALPGRPGAKVAHFVAIECKTQTGRVSREQREFLDELTAAGGVALVVRSVDDLRAWLAGRGLLAEAKP